jgi:hypothetical protein
VIIWNSKLELKIHNLDISTDRKEKIKRNFEIYLSIIVFNKIKLFKVNLKKIKTKKINLGTVLERAKKLEEKGDKVKWIIELIKSLSNFKIEIKEVDLKAEIGTEDAAITAILVGIISSILGIILKSQKFEVLPIYQDKNVLNVKLNCIFRLNLIHYIYKTILKGRDKNERKPSDRRPYTYSNE